MSSDRKRAPLENSLKIETLSFAKIPHQSKLFLDFQADSPVVSKFYPEKQSAPAAFAAEVLANYATDRNALCDALKETNESIGASTKTFENIAFLRENDCLAVVTGQQAGLFSGPLYTIYKALSAVRRCEDLKKEDIKAVPVFWIAEEDHDFEEIKKTFVSGGLTSIENTPETYKNNFPVGAVKLDESISNTIENLFSTLPEAQVTHDLKTLLSASYAPGETFSTAFAKLLARIFADYGLIFVLPLDRKLKKLCAPIFVEAVESSEKIVSALLARNAALESESYQAQVLVEENSFPFFLFNDDGERQSLRRDPESKMIKVQRGKAEFDQAALKEIAENSPERLSPNALLRPVVQDYLLPTLSYIGGAAEVAYFAQNAVIYEILNRPVTPIRHRASFTVVEPKHQRTLEKYQLKFADLFNGKEKVFAGIVEKFLNDETAREFADVEKIIKAQLDRLDQHLSKSEPTLSDNLANRRRKILWHIGALRKKYHRAEIVKNETASRRIESLFAELLPGNHLQERSLNVLSFLNLYGENFIRWVYEAIRSEEKSHRIIYL